jgi:hypothetical protein
VPLVDKEMGFTALVVERCRDGDVVFDQDGFSSPDLSFSEISLHMSSTEKKKNPSLSIRNSMAEKKDVI